ncbi:MAG: DUF1080 domain-containing protein [Planctomycetes bacterium]|nr:DUF1080 domain-containing protein [Planctomycetota bacterium]
MNATRCRGRLSSCASRAFLLGAALALSCGSLAAEVLEPEPRPLRALLITGGCCHDYNRQKAILTEGISARAAVEWVVVQEGGSSTSHRVSVYKKPDWAKGFDVVVHNECFSDEKDPEWLQGIVREHAAGVPAVVIHCAMHCYRTGTDEWFKLVGVTSHRHGSHFAYELKNRKPDHPIMKGFPASWQTPKEELYNIAKVWPEATTLGTGYSPETKADETCIWVNAYGKARVFGTTVGHYWETMEQPVYLDCVARGLLWACGKLDESGEPEPGYEPRPRDWSERQKLPEGEKPVRLFNGRDLDGWEGQTDRHWSVCGGEIVGRNDGENAPKASTYLTTRKPYRSFRLIFEGKLATSEMHSGVALWGQKVEKEGDPHSYLGHLVMFPSDWGFWDLYRRNGIYRDDGRAKAAGRQHDWNQMEILAIGDRIRLAVNGKLVADWRDPRPELCQPGPIGLQLHSNTVPQEVRFRGLILSEDPKDAMVTVKG